MAKERRWWQWAGRVGSVLAGSSGDGSVGDLAVVE